MEELPEEVAGVNKITKFKRHLERYMDRKGFGEIWAKTQPMGLVQVGNMVGIDMLD